MAIYSLTTTIPTGRNGSFVWFPIETDLTIEQLHQRLAEDGCVGVTKLEIDRPPNGTAVLKGRRPVIVGVNGVATIVPFHLRFADAA